MSLICYLLLNNLHAISDKEDHVVYSEFNIVLWKHYTEI